MTPRSTRALLRTVHLALGLCVGAVIYLPPGWTEQLRLALGLLVVPTVAVTGLAMWQQPRLRRIFRRAERSSV
jgi:hypothetical protein